MSGKVYDPAKIEAKWSQFWKEKGVYETDEEDKGEKSYVLGMFPYPSGDGLHTGHVRIYTATDVLARYQRMQGMRVMFPMGWDAFGLPAENAAIKTKSNPKVMVPKNEANFRRQMESLGLSYDWGREFSTTDPKFYKWTQWLFLKLYSLKNKKGERLIYRDEVAINWCPFCKTGLANEEVLADGTHERCGTKVVQKLLPQWVMRITDYADRLLNDLEGLDWPKGILEMQRNWIGKKEGVVINHKIKSADLQVETFSAYPAWLFADTFIVLAPEHPLVKELVEGTKLEKEVLAFAEESCKESRQEIEEGKLEKKGVFTGHYALDPFNEGREMPIWVANFALMDFGTGAIRCSAHDPRDNDFASKYGIELKEVVERETDLPVNAHDNQGELKDSGPFTGREITPELIREMVDWIVEQKIGRRETSYHLRDWVFSRQRYWGEPFPLVYCDKCGDENGVVTIPEDQLPLTLPDLESYEPTETGESPLAKVSDWVNTTCPKCGGRARRETDTMPNWAGSCWYFLRFADPGNDKEAFSKEAMDKWLPVDWYLGGAEHAVLHLLYARFWVKAFNDLGLLSFTEPFTRLRSVGLVLAEDGKKMSKSLGNIVSPDDVVATYGADAVRIYEMFMGPWEQAIAWQSRSLVGGYRFLEKIWKLANRDMELSSRESDSSLEAELNRVIKKVGEDIVAIKFNTAIASLMEFSNKWAKSKVGLTKEDIKRVLLVLAPFAPFMTEELWSKLGENGSIHLRSWPTYSEVKQEMVTIPVQVNGRLRSTVTVESSRGSDQAEVMKLVTQDEKVKKWIEDKEYKVVFVPGRLVNFVLSS